MSVAGDDVVITGFGVFTAFGFGEKPLLDGVFAGKHAFREVERFDVARLRCHVAAVYDGSGPAAPDVPFDADWAPDQLGMLLACSRAALEMARVDPSAVAGALVGSQGDQQPVTRYWQHRAALDDGATGDPVPDVRTSFPAQLAHELGDELGVGPARMTFTNACIASADTLIHASRLIRSGRADAYLCTGSYLVERELFAKFDSARALAGKDGVVRPFSKGRAGLLLGDGAGAIVVESGRSAARRGATVLAKLTGTGITSDAYHVSRPHPEGLGTARAMETAVRRAGLTPDDVDYLNLHGTGTPSNDPSETAAVHRVFGGRRIPVSSTKSATGHTLEAAGVVEAVITLLAMLHEKAPPTANFVEPDPACDLDCIPEGARPMPIRRALTTNSAFGGVNSALLMELP